MGYALLWLATLGAELLLFATLVACIARIKLPLLRTSVLVLLIVTVAAAYGGMLFFVEWLEHERWAHHDWRQPWWALAILFSLGATLILFSGWRRTGAEPGVSRAATWPLGKLAIALVVAMALDLMTFWNLDVAVRQRLSALRVEAGALALSVAPPKIPDPDNAAIVYEQVFELMGPEKDWKKRRDAKWDEWLKPDNADFDPGDQELRQFLADQAPALALLRQVVDKPGCYFQRDYGRPRMTTLLPEIARIRDAAKLLALDARVKAADGDVRGALEDLSVLFAMAGHIATEPILVSVLVGIRVETLAMESLENILATSQASPGDLAAVRIPRWVSFWRSVSRAFGGEEALGLSVYYEYGAEARFDELMDTRNRETSTLAPFYRVFLLNDDLAAYREAFQQPRVLASRPFYQAAQQWKRYEEDIQSGVPGILANLILPRLDAAAEYGAMGDARHRLAQLGLAACRYRLEHGQLPDKLEDVTDGVTVLVSRDPFDGKPLKWRPTETGLVLYSIGPDLVDNGGLPFDKDKRTGDLTFAIGE